MNSLLTIGLATASRFYTHGAITFLIIGIVFTAVGYSVGKLAWRHCDAEAVRIEAANEKLESAREIVRAEIEQLEAKIESLQGQAPPET